MEDELTKLREAIAQKVREHFNEFSGRGFAQDILDLPEFQALIQPKPPVRVAELIEELRTCARVGLGNDKSVVATPVQFFRDSLNIFADRLESLQTEPAQQKETFESDKWKDNQTYDRGN